MVVKFHFTDTLQHPPARFYVSDTGSIECYAPPCNRTLTHWCGHIKQAMRNNADSAAIEADVWEKYESIPLDIPMFPTSNVWTKVSILKVDKRKELWWVNPLISQLTSLDKDPSAEFLGFISPGEGRNTIRQLLIEHMYAYHDFTAECEASHHGPAAQRQWQKNTDPLSKLRFAEWWSIFTTSQCLTCQTLLENFADLIPISEQRGVWYSDEE